MKKLKVVVSLDVLLLEVETSFLSYGICGIFLRSKEAQRLALLVKKVKVGSESARSVRSLSLIISVRRSGLTVGFSCRCGSMY